MRTKKMTQKIKNPTKGIRKPIKGTKTVGLLKKGKAGGKKMMGGGAMSMRRPVRRMKKGGRA